MRHKETSTKDSSPLQHAKADTFQYSSSSTQEYFPSIVTPTNTSTTTTISFKVLNPYQRYLWIQGREIVKTTLRNYNNLHGSGKVFGFDLIDRDRDEIHLFAFPKLVDSFYNIIQVEKIYIVSNDTVKETNRNYNHLKKKWDIFLFVVSTIKQSLQDDPTFPYQCFKFQNYQ